MRRTAAAFALLAALGGCTPAPAPEPEVQAAGEVVINITSPAPGARVTSPLRVEGTAPGDWFFEAVFPVQLRSADGQVLAEAPAQAQSDWMTEAPVPFVAELRFEITAETQATLVLQEDMPGEEQAPREILLPVVLVPR